MNKSQLPRDYVWSKAKLPFVPDVLSEAVPFSISACQATRDNWIREGTQLAVRVSSVIISEESNVLLNPNRTDYESLLWTEPRTFHFDPRLFSAEPRIL